MHIHSLENQHEKTIVYVRRGKVYFLCMLHQFLSCGIPQILFITGKLYSCNTEMTGWKKTEEQCIGIVNLKAKRSK